MGLRLGHALAPCALFQYFCNYFLREATWSIPALSKPKAAASRCQWYGSCGYSYRLFLYKLIFLWKQNSSCVWSGGPSHPAEAGLQRREHTGSKQRWHRQASLQFVMKRSIQPDSSNHWEKRESKPLCTHGNKLLLPQISCGTGEKKENHILLLLLPHYWR